MKKTLSKTPITPFEAIFQYANEGILTTDTHGVIRTVNPAACKLFQYQEKELIDRKVECLIPKRYSNHISHREKFVKKPHARSMGAELDLFGIKKDGIEFPLEVSLSPYQANGELFVIAFVIDNSQRKEAEAKEKNYRAELENEVQDRTLILKEAILKLEKTKLNLDESLAREKQASTLKSQFVSIASHEFRTPLSTMLSSLVLIEKYGALGEDEKQKKHIERIKKSIRSLTEILNDILSINKLEEGKTVPQMNQLELFKFVDAVISELSLITKIGQKIEVNWAKKLPTTIKQDEKLLRHVLTNLISNAVKFSSENTIIEINIFENGKKLIFEIKDQGIGIPEANIAQLFTRFYRADNAGQIQGTGLGLSIVKQYCELLGGEVSVKSKIGEGSTFEISIPI